MQEFKRQFVLENTMESGNIGNVRLFGVSSLQMPIVAVGHDAGVDS
jgi:hypothetical protein